jgi:Na+-translocating ferredoxin:NAD+ oxidoreductase RnfD subunit
MKVDFTPFFIIPLWCASAYSLGGHIAFGIVAGLLGVLLLINGARH